MLGRTILFLSSGEPLGKAATLGWHEGWIRFLPEVAAYESKIGHVLLAGENYQDELQKLFPEAS